MEAQWQNSVSKSSDNNAGDGEPKDKETERRESSQKETEITNISKTASRELINTPVINNEQPMIPEEEEVASSSNKEISVSNDNSKDSGLCSAN